MGSSNSGKGVSLSSSSPVPEPYPSGGGETNENLMNPQKTVTKQFMSSTIFATPMTATKEKSILGERNGADSSYSPIQKPLTHVERSNLTHSRFQLPHRSSLAVFEPDDDDLSSKQNDPLTNYHFPRPKYLRYRPDWHRELFLSLESRDYGVQRSFSADDEGPTGHARGPPFPLREVTSPSENEVKVDGGNVESEDDDETDEEEENEEEEGCLKDSRQSSNRFLRFLLFTAAVLLSPLFVSLMDNSPSSPVVYGFGEMNNVFGGVSLNRSASEYQNEIEVSPRWELDERVEIGVGVELPVDEEEMFTGTSNMPSEGCRDQENLEKEATESDAGEVEGGFDQPPTSEPMENRKVHSVGEMEEKGGGFDLPMQHGAFELALETPSASEDYASDVIQEFVQVVEPAAASVESIRETFLEETEMSDDSVDSDDSKDEDTAPGRMSDDSKDSAGVAVNMYSKLQQIVLPPAAIAIVSLLSLILAYAYSARQPRTSHEQSNAVLEPPPQKVNAEKIEPNANDSASIDPVEEYHRCTASNLFPPLEHSSRVELEATSGTEKLPGVKIAGDAPFLVGSVKDSVQELSSHTKTLEVELLGEFVIGEASSSLRACVRKPKMLPETEESSYSFSQVSGGSPKLLHPPLESPTSDYSFGRRLTTQKKQLPKKKEKGNDGEATKKVVITTTPVRRSSRIRNRGGGVMSP